jgi:hypothetical protein
MSRSVSSTRGWSSTIRICFEAFVLIVASSSVRASLNAQSYLDSDRSVNRAVSPIWPVGWSTCLDRGAISGNRVIFLPINDGIRIASQVS